METTSAAICTLLLSGHDFSFFTSKGRASVSEVRAHLFEALVHLPEMRKWFLDMENGILENIYPGEVHRRALYKRLALRAPVDPMAIGQLCTAALNQSTMDSLPEPSHNVLRLTPEEMERAKQFTFGRSLADLRFETLQRIQTDSNQQRTRLCLVDNQLAETKLHRRVFTVISPKTSAQIDQMEEGVRSVEVNLEQLDEKILELNSKLWAADNRDHQALALQLEALSRARDENIVLLDEKKSEVESLVDNSKHKAKSIYEHPLGNDDWYLVQNISEHVSKPSFLTSVHYDISLAYKRVLGFLKKNTQIRSIKVGKYTVYHFDASRLEATILGASQ